MAKSRHMPVAVVDDMVTTESVSKFTLIKYPGETRKKKKKSISVNTTQIANPES